MVNVPIANVGDTFVPSVPSGCFSLLDLAALLNCYFVSVGLDTGK